MLNDIYQLPRRPVFTHTVDPDEHTAHQLVSSLSGLTDALTAARLAGDLPRIRGLMALLNNCSIELATLADIAATYEYDLQVKQ